MIKLDEVIKVHAKLIDEFGGSSGVRDHSLLDSAIKRPFQTFNMQDLYSTTQSKAAAIIESILINHPFVDGNKRTGYYLMRSILLSNNLDLDSNEDDKYQFVIQIASGELRFPQILSWIEERSIKSSL